MPTLQNKAKKAVQKLTKVAKDSIKPLTKKTKKDLATMQDLFLVQMKDLYDNEKQLIKALPKVAKNATSSQLRNMLDHHLHETKEHAKRLEEIYTMMGMNPKRQTSQGMKGLIKDGAEVMKMKAEPELLDAAITANSQHIEHHEIAGYKATIEWAKLLDMPKAAALLERNLEQEIHMNDKLTALAKQSINKKAASTR